MKSLKVGIASYSDMKARTMAIARAELKPRPGDPEVWFTSIESFARVLSDRNRALLRLIMEEEPQSLTALAEISGRAKSNLSRTLHTLERYHLVHLEKTRKGRLLPRVPYSRIVLETPITTGRRESVHFPEPSAAREPALPDRVADVRESYGVDHAETLPNPHPGKILLGDFLQPMRISQAELARAIGVPPRHINEMVLGKRAVTAQTDLLLTRYFGLSEGLFLRLQAAYDLDSARVSLKDRLTAIRPRDAA